MFKMSIKYKDSPLLLKHGMSTYFRCSYVKCNACVIQYATMNAFKSIRSMLLFISCSCSFQFLYSELSLVTSTSDDFNVFLKQSHNAKSMMASINYTFQKLPSCLEFQFKNSRLLSINI